MTAVRRLTLLWLVLSGIALPLRAEEAAPSVGVDLQRYPVGTIASLVYRRPLNPKSVWWVGIGYNDADRKDNGEFSDEQARGPGVSGGYRIFLGGRIDVWDLKVDWIDQLGTVSETRGTTDTLVVQPTAVVAHGWGLGRWRAEVSLALGAEINVKTDGPDVGEGAIVLGGVAFHRRF